MENEFCSSSRVTIDNLLQINYRNEFKFIAISTYNLFICKSYKLSFTFCKRRNANYIPNI